VLVWPVRVQGETSAAETANGIRGFNALEKGGAIPRPDLIIVARGGGSLEDLWGFNEEVVVRAAAESQIPLISAVGHETDWTLIDHAADWRAPTPTAAAERAVPVRSELLAYVADLAARHHRAVSRAMDERRTRVMAAGRGLPRPDDLLALARQRFDNAAGRLGQSLKAATVAHRSRLDRAAARLTVRPLRQQIVRDRDTLVRLQRQAGRAVAAAMQARRNRLDGATKLLSAFSYHSVLNRGFALVRDAQGQPLRSVSATSAGMGIEIEFADGRTDAVIGKGGGGIAPVARKTAPKPDGGGETGGGQGSLF
jgi:exodeoxyribonuclease VII large subunit